MMQFRLISFLALCFAVAPASGEIYKWKDADGHVHYSSSVPAEHKKSATITPNTVQVADAPVLNTESSPRKSKTDPNQAGNTKAPTVSTVNASDASKSIRISDEKKACEAEWAKYRESVACFTPYGLVGGGVNGEAFNHCTEVKQPPQCE